MSLYSPIKFSANEAKILKNVRAARLNQNLLLLTKKKSVMQGFATKVPQYHSRTWKHVVKRRAILIWPPFLTTQDVC